MLENYVLEMGRVCIIDFYIVMWSGGGGGGYDKKILNWIIC